MKILVTGFKDFNGTHNPTQYVANELNGLRVDGVEVVGKVLSVSWDDTWDEFVKEVTDHQPLSGIVSFGVEEGISKMRLETTAQNWMQDGVPIIENGPYKLPTNLPLEFIRKAWKGKKGEGIKIVPSIPEMPLLDLEMSNDAGSFLCNYTFYNEIYHYCAREVPVRGFVHTPGIETGKNKIIQSAAYMVKCVASWLTKE